MSEKDYSLGERNAWIQILNICTMKLGYQHIEKKSWIEEREAAIRELRDLCEKFGDNEWKENLHLADIIEKHLGKHLYENE